MRRRRERSYLSKIAGRENVYGEKKVVSSAASDGTFQEASFLAVEIRHLARKRVKGHRTRQGGESHYPIRQAVRRARTVSGTDRGSQASVGNKRPRKENGLGTQTRCFFGLNVLEEI